MLSVILNGLPVYLKEDDRDTVVLGENEVNYDELCRAVNVLGRERAAIALTEPTFTKEQLQAVGIGPAYIQRLLRER